MNDTMPTGKRSSLPLVLLLVVALALVTFGLLSRRSAYAALQRDAAEAAVITVTTINPDATGQDDDGLVLPGSAQGENDVALYARGKGYVRRVLVDIGAPVKSGQLMAEIDTPELDEELRQAEAEFATSRANHDLARSTAERWEKLAEQHLVANQAAEEKSGDALAKQAVANASSANVKRLQRLSAFKRIVAPFDGIVAERNIEAGQLIDDSGAASEGSGGARALFRVASANKLRIYAQVPQSAAGSIRPGMPAELAFPDRPGKKYPATVTRSANAIDTASRTLRVELSADNAAGELLPGSFMEIHFKLPRATGGVRLPVSTLIFRGKGAMVAVVGADGRVKLAPITIGRDFGTEFEVTAGLAPGDAVVVNPPDSLIEGQKVRRAAKAPDT